MDVHSPAVETGGTQSFAHRIKPGTRIGVEEEEEEGEEEEEEE
jgi:hypothetical protein